MTNQKEKDNAKENSRKNILKRLLQNDISTSCGYNLIHICREN